MEKFVTRDSGERNFKFYLFVFVLSIINIFIAWFLWLSLNIILAILGEGTESLGLSSDNFIVYILESFDFLFETGPPYTTSFFYLIPANLILILFFIVELLLGSWLIVKLKYNGVEKFSNIFLNTLVIFSISTLLIPIIFPTIDSAIGRLRYPIEASQKTYDFSKPTQITNRKTNKEYIQMEGNKIIWIEQTAVLKKGGEQDNLILFEFDPKTSQATTTQITDHDRTAKVDTLMSDAIIAGKEIYWIQWDRVDGVESVKYSIYRYNLESKKTELLTEVSNSPSIYGKYQNYLIMTIGIIDINNFLLLDLSNKKMNKLTLDIPQDSLPGDIMAKGQYICYSTERIINPEDLTKNEYGIWRYDLVSNKNELLKSERRALSLLDCKENLMVYIVIPASSEEKEELQVYDLTNKKTIFTKKSKEGEVTLNIGSGELQDNKFYYNSARMRDDNICCIDSLFVLNLEDGKEKILADDILGGGLLNLLWDIENAYLVYSKYSDGGCNDIYLQKLPK